MNRKVATFLVSAAFSTFIIGWILLSQRPADRFITPMEQTVFENLDATDTGSSPTFDEVRAEALRTGIERSPDDAGLHVELANLYFGAKQFDEAIVWFERALELNPQDANVYADLGVSYYYMNQPDHALEQFGYALELDPKHAKTMLRMGVVRAFGKQDLDGAEAAWRQVIELAPDSGEARSAQEALELLKAAHSGRGDTDLATLPNGGS